MIMTLMVLYLLAGCGGSDGPQGLVGNQGNAGSVGVTGATGATGTSAVFGTVTVTATKIDGTPASGFDATLQRVGATLKSEGINGSDTAGTGTYVFQNIAAGTYDLYVTGKTYFEYYQRVTVSGGDTPVNITLYENLYISGATGPSGNVRQLASIFTESDPNLLISDISASLSPDDCDYAAIDTDGTTLYMTARLLNPTGFSGYYWYLFRFDMSADPPTLISSTQLNTAFIPEFDPNSARITDLAVDGSGNLYGFFAVGYYGPSKMTEQVSYYGTNDQLGRIESDGTVTVMPRPSFTDGFGNGIGFSPVDGKLYFITSSYYGLKMGASGGSSSSAVYTWDITGGTLTKIYEGSNMTMAGPLDFMPGKGIFYYCYTTSYDANFAYLDYFDTATNTSGYMQYNAYNFYLRDGFAFPTP